MSYVFNHKLYGECVLSDNKSSNRDDNPQSVDYYLKGDWKNLKQSSISDTGHNFPIEILAVHCYTLNSDHIWSEDNNPAFDIQKQYAKDENAPLFAHRTCWHTYGYFGKDRGDRPRTLTGMMVRKYSSLPKALEVAGSELITGCPCCGVTWCD